MSVTITDEKYKFLPYKTGEIVDQKQETNPSSGQEETFYKIRLTTNITPVQCFFNVTDVWLFSEGFVNN